MYFDDDIYDDDNKQEFVITYADLIKFEKFKMAYPTYISDLHSGMKILYETYLGIYNKKIFSYEQQHYEVAYRIGFGMLMRHILETISAYLIAENGIKIDDDKTVFDRLTALNESNVPGYDSKKNKILMDALDLTNEIAHPHIIGNKVTSFKQLNEFYLNFFKPLIESHVSSKPLSKRAKRDKKMTDAYILELKERLDYFDIDEKVTSILIKGCLVRHLTENAVNYYSYINYICPTDISTLEDQISISGNLTKLSALAKKKNILSQKIITHLFTLKNTSNDLMHENQYNINVFASLSDKISEVYYTVIEECSPNIIDGKEKIKYRVYKPLFTTSLLCGFTGWLGLHQFYSGNIGQGMFILLFNLLGISISQSMIIIPNHTILGKVILVVLAVLYILTLVFTLGNLNKIRLGHLKTKKWGTLPKNDLTSVLSVIFIFIHFYVNYFLISRILLTLKNNYFISPIAPIFVIFFIIAFLNKNKLLFRMWRRWLW